MDQYYKVEKPRSLITSIESEMNFHLPEKALNDYIFPFLWGTINHPQIEEVTTRPIPTGNIVMYLHNAAPIKVYDFNFQHFTFHSAFVTGIHTLNKLTFLRATGTVENLVITFKPGGFFNVFHRNAIDIKNKVVNLADLLGIEGDKLINEFQDSQSVSEKVEIVNHFLTDRLSFHSSSAKYSSGYENLPIYIQERKGCVTLNQVCEEFALQPRTVERYFNRDIGISPKEYIDIIRFNYLLNFLRDCNFVNWQEIIYSFGFYDQSHFIRSFKAVTGYSPIEFIRSQEHGIVLLDRFQIVHLVKDLLPGN